MGKSWGLCKPKAAIHLVRSKIMCRRVPGVRQDRGTEEEMGGARRGFNELTQVRCLGLAWGRQVLVVILTFFKFIPAWTSIVWDTLNDFLSPRKRESRFELEGQKYFVGDSFRQFSLLTDFFFFFFLPVTSLNSFGFLASSSLDIFIFR